MCGIFAGGAGRAVIDGSRQRATRNLPPPVSRLRKISDAFGAKGLF
jgi:hypothetical protein